VKRSALYPNSHTAMSISAKEVNNLRQITGAGLMDCKKALEESGGDVDKAIDILRKKGQKVMQKRADMEANEGAVFAGYSADRSFGVIFEMSSETDFVAKNENFIEVGNAILAAALQHQPKSSAELLALTVADGRTANDLVIEIVGKIAEKIEITKYDFLHSEQVASYIHPGAKIGVLVGFSGTDGVDIALVGKDISMQIAAMNPLALDKDAVDPATVEKEIEIGKEQARAEGKAEAVLEKIAVGKLAKFYKDNTLVEQEFVKDPNKSVAQYLAEHSKTLKITGFKRMRIGG
jgi:elongation factor Ts